MKDIREMAAPFFQEETASHFADGSSASERIQLFLRCTNLRDMDVFSKSDPKVFVYMMTPPERDKWILIGKTEVVKDNLNPAFVTPINVNFLFEVEQVLRFLVVDVDNESDRPEDHDFLGSVVIPVAAIVAHAQSFEKELLDKSNKAGRSGKLIVTAERPVSSRQWLSMQFGCHNLAAKDWFGLGRSDPYVLISRSREDAGWTPVYRSEVIKSNLNPFFAPAEVSMTTLCNNDPERTLLIQVYDWNRSSPHVLIGQVETTVNQLISGQRSLPLIDPSSKKSHKSVGTIQFHLATLTEKHSFVDYVATGYEISLITSIDFTASNRRPDDPRSLHYVPPYAPYGNATAPLNQYQQAITAVGTILAHYDSDKKFPVYGFGARFANNQVSHCFPLNGIPQNPEVQGIEGILAVYSHCLKYVTLDGPTNFAPTIRLTHQMILNEMNRGQSRKYYILLIITDGVISDMQQTVHAIVEASYLPLSIVIVGVGEANFENMNALDSDDQLLKAYDGSVAQRDIVQFVPFSRMRNNPDQLARETLAEIPRQFMEYATLHRIPLHPS